MMRMATEHMVEIPAGWVNGLAYGISFAVIGGLLFSMFHSIAMAVAGVVVGILLFGSAWGLSWDLGTMAFLGFGGGLLGRVALGNVPDDPKHAKSIPLQIATVFIGIVVAVIILLTLTTLPVIFMRGNIQETGLRFGLIYGSILGISSSLVFALIYGYQVGFDQQRIIRSSLIVTLGCVLAGLLFGSRTFLIEDLVVSIVIGMQSAIVAFTLFLISNHFASLLGGGRAGAIAAGLATGAGGVLAFATSFNPLSRPGNWHIVAIVGITSTILGLTIMFWRPIITYPFLLVWNLIVVRQEEKYIDATGRRMNLHSAFWDQHQWLPIIGLNDYLLLLLEREPELGHKALNAIAQTRQSWAAQAAQIEHDARQLEQRTTLKALSNYHQTIDVTLPVTSAATPIIRALGGISRDVSAALAQSSRFNHNMVLQEAEAQTNSLIFELSRNNDHIAQRFRPIVIQWLNVIGQALADVDQKNNHLEIVNPYVVGVPLTRKQQLFVGRSDVSHRLEELLRHQDHPPFLLFGQRRMGKTSLIYQLRWLLPKRILPITVDLQGPVALARDHAGFLYNFGKQVIQSADQQQVRLPALERDRLNLDPFTAFDDWLMHLEDLLAKQGIETVLLCLDEFETLGYAFEKGTLEEESVLGMLRHVIQHRPRFKLLLAGSHLLDSFPTWSSYLINVETIKLGCLEESEARQLIENPIAGFELSYDPEALEKILRLTNGHPYLLQLVCAEMVTQKNEGALESRFRVVSAAEVEQIIPDVLVRGRQFFVDMEQNQFPAGTLPILQKLAKAGSLTAAKLAIPEELKPAFQRLLTMEFVKEQDGSYRLPIELIRHWLIS